MCTSWWSWWSIQQLERQMLPFRSLVETKNRAKRRQNGWSSIGDSMSAWCLQLVRWCRFELSSWCCLKELSTHPGSLKSNWFNVVHWAGLEKLETDPTQSVSVLTWGSPSKTKDWMWQPVVGFGSDKMLKAVLYFLSPADHQCGILRPWRQS